ncbi:hypothetical protein [Microcoleus sp.]|uniref:hypothetical protein n=1 Tax=Microcoleus sp. TaxID=44472 RepID=UPI00403EC7FB
MYKLLYFATIGLLAFSIGGCGGEGSNTASPSPSPSPPSPSPAASASPTPAAQTFQSPVVAAQPPGLIRSTNPDERARQTQTGIGNNKNRNPTLPLQPVPQGPLTADPSQVDPFGPLPPIVVQNPPGVGGVPGGVPAGPMTANPLPKLPERQVAMIPKLPELSRPVQIGGVKLKGPTAPQINLSPTARRVVTEFRTLQALLDETTQNSEYDRDVGTLVDTIYGTLKEDNVGVVRRELLLTNRPLFRRIEKALDEYRTASNLWDIYGERSPSDALRCSIVPEIAEAIEVYRPPTVRRGELSCVTRGNLLQAVWRQGKNRLDAALRDQDYEARTIAKAPLLPVLSESPTNRQPEGEKALGRQLASLPQVPGLRSPQNPILPQREGSQLGSPRLIPGLDAPQLASRPGQPGFPGGEGAQIGSPRQVPGIDTPPFGSRPISPPTTSTNPRRPPRARAPQPIAARPIGVPDLPELPVDKRPPQWRDPNPPPPPQIPVVPAPPPPPSTDLATGTEVSGVVKVGNETQVIVKVPNEPTSRYVKIGQRLSNGQVLVKRVDIKAGADPVVILEENGVEVAKAVGEKPPSREQKPTNAIISRGSNPNRSTRR